MVSRPGFLEGVRCVFLGGKRFFREPRFRTLGLLSFFLSVLAYLLALSLAVAASPRVLELLWARPEPAWLLALWYLLLALVVGGLLLLGMLLFVGIATAIAGPFYEKMAERVMAEHELTSKSPGIFVDLMVDLGWTLVATAASLSLSALSLLPVVGLGFSVAAVVVTGMGLATSALGPAHNASGFGFRGRARFVRGHLGFVAGIGVMMSLAVLVPILGLLAFPSAVIGGTERMAKDGLLQPKD